jgi:hypothetical protein
MTYEQDARPISKYDWMWSAMHLQTLHYPATCLTCHGYIKEENYYKLQNTVLQNTISFTTLHIVSFQ